MTPWGMRVVYSAEQPIELGARHGVYAALSVDLLESHDYNGPQVTGLFPAGLVADSL